MNILDRTVKAQPHALEEAGWTQITHPVDLFAEEEFLCRVIADAVKAGRKWILRSNGTAFVELWNR